MSKEGGVRQATEPDWEDFEDDEIKGDWFCPQCGEEYDEIDQEYQICHLCRFNNNPKKETL